MIENSNFVGLSHQMALRRQMDIIANNIANINTTSFRGERALFEEFLIPTSEGRKISYVQDVGLVRDLAEGQLLTTGNPLDVAIAGKGFFVVETPVGPRYTRNGNFTVNDKGVLVTAEGRPLLDDDNRTIKIEATDSDVTIAGDGSITAASGPIARLQVVSFGNEQRLKKQGGTLYSSAEPPTPVKNPRIVQGALEKSNVQPIVEMTQMIEVLRNYQSTQRLVDTNHDLQRKAVEKIGRPA